MMAMGAMRATAGHVATVTPRHFEDRNESERESSHDGDGFSPDKELKRAQTQFLNQ